MINKQWAAIIVVALATSTTICGISWNLAQKQLATARDEVSSLETTLENMESELSAAEEELLNINTELQDTRLMLSAMQTDRLNLHNPTLDEVTSFLAEDTTDSNEYIKDAYVCSHFARDVNNNAQSQGIRCAFVDIRYPESAHAIVAFDTVDEGVVYFDAVTDERVRPVMGKEYWRCVEAQPGYDYEKPSFDDTIMDILLIW